MSLSKRVNLLTLLAFLFCHPGFSQNDNVLKLTVKDARDFAIQNNRTVQSSRIDLDIANQKIRENLSTGLPQLSVDANYTHQFKVPELSFGPNFNPDLLPAGPVTGDDIRDAFSDGPSIPLGVKDNTVIDITLSQLIFNGQYLVALKTAKIARSMSEKNIEKTEDQIKENVEVSYYLILVLQENIRLLKETEETLNKMYVELSGMNQQGLNEETEVDQVAINRSNVRALIASMESQADIARKQFKYLLGIGFEQEVEFTDSLAGIIDEGNLLYLKENEFELQNSIDFQMVEIQEKINNQVLKLEKSKYLPTISAFYRHQEQTNQPAFNFAVKDVVGATLNLPIYSGNLRSSKVKQAKYDIEKIKLARHDTEQGLTMEYETARNNYQSAYNTFSINRESMDLSQKVYNKNLIKYREGVSTSFELTQLHNQFLTAESNYYNSLLALLRSKAELDRLLRINK